MILEFLIVYFFFMVAMGKMVVHDTKPYTGEIPLKRLYVQKFIFQGIFTLLASLLISYLLSEFTLGVYLIFAGVTSWLYFRLICLGCRKHTPKRYANLMVLLLFIFTSWSRILLPIVNVVAFLVLGLRLHWEYNKAKENPQPATRRSAPTLIHASNHTASRSAHTYGAAAWGNDDACQEKPWQFEAYDAYEEEENWQGFAAYEDDDNSVGWSDNPNTIDYNATDWNSYNYSSNPEVAASVLENLF